MSITQPRKPAGSTDGGQFTSTNGAEASMGLHPNLAHIQALALEHGEDFHADDAAMTAAQRARFESSTKAIIAVAEATCPDLEAVRWEWCGDGDAPNTLSALFDCPHMGRDRDSRDVIEFEEAHRLPPDTIGDVCDPNPYMHEMDKWGGLCGVEETPGLAIEFYYTPQGRR